MKTNNLKLAVIALAIALAAQSAVAAPLESKPILSLEAARGMVAAAEAAAAKNHWHMVIAIVDDGGNLLILERMDGTHLASIDIAQRKAHTAAIFAAPSKNFSEALAGGNTAMLALGVLPFEGGIPIMVDGKQVGSIGVSGGAQAPMDGQVAQAGLDWLAAHDGK